MRGQHPDNRAQRKCRDGGKHAGRFPRFHAVPRFSEAFSLGIFASKDRLRAEVSSAPRRIYGIKSTFRLAQHNSSAWQPASRRNGRFGSEADLTLPSRWVRFTPQSGHREHRPMCPLRARYCCKSPFALVTKNSPGCRRDFRVQMWVTSSPDYELTGDFGNVIETTQIGGRRLVRLMPGNLSPGNFGLLQHNLPKPDSCTAANSISIRSPRRRGRAAWAGKWRRAPWQPWD